MVWARAGRRVAIYDANTDALELASKTLSRFVSDSENAGFALPQDLMSRVSTHAALKDALADADFVQESAPEDVEIKRSLFRELDRLTKPEGILASSTSAIMMSQFTEDLQHRHRCVIVHPATPPHMLPATEIVPAPWTAPSVVDRVFALLEAVGQTPVLVKKEIPGFALNRMQGTLLIEMFRLIESGVISAAHADKLISDGFGLRWAFLGPLEGVDLNAQGGIADYLARFGHIFDNMASERREPGPVLTPSLIAQLAELMREKLPLDQIEAKRSWRDRRVAMLKRLRIELEDQA